MSRTFPIGLRTNTCSIRGTRAGDRQWEGLRRKNRESESRPEPSPLWFDGFDVENDAGVTSGGGTSGKKSGAVLAHYAEPNPTYAYGSRGPQDEEEAIADEQSAHLRFVFLCLPLHGSPSAAFL